MRKKGAQNNRSTTSKGGAADSNSSGEKKHKAKAPPQPWTRMVMMMVPLSEACIQALIDVNRVSLIDGTTPAAMSTSSVTSNKQSKVARCQKLENSQVLLVIKTEEISMLFLQQS